MHVPGSAGAETGLPLPSKHVPLQLYEPVLVTPQMLAADEHEVPINAEQAGGGEGVGELVGKAGFQHCPQLFPKSVHWAPHELGST